jgi:RNA polymerase sigma-70 factor (ECF subfamily)
MDSPSAEREAAVRAAAGDGPAFRALVDAWRGRVFGFCLRMGGDAASAEDLAQEVFLHLYQVLRRYDPERPFGPWMRRVMTNVVLNRLRSRPAPARRLEGPDGEAELPADPRSPDPAGAAERADDAALLRRQVAALPPGWRAVLALRYDEGLSVAEIAEALDLPANTVKTRLFRAREALRAALSGPDGAWPDGAVREP